MALFEQESAKQSFYGSWLWSDEACYRGGLSVRMKQTLYVSIMFFDSINTPKFHVLRCTKVLEQKTG